MSKLHSFVGVAVLLFPLHPAVAQQAASEEVNAAANAAGARWHYESDDYGVTGEMRAIGDGRLGTASDNEGDLAFQIDEKLPIVRRLELAEPFELSRLELVGSTEGVCCAGSHPGSSVKKLKLELGVGLNGPWKPLIDVTLKKGTAPQSFKLTASKARFFRVSFIENFGNKETISVGELRLFGKRSAPRQKIDFTGAYSNTMLLEQKGLRVTGCIGGADTSFEGTVDGVVLSGQKRSKGEEPVELALVLNAEGELRGTDGWNGGRFDGERVSASDYSMSCEKVEGLLAAELKEKGRVVLRGILFDTGKDVIRGESIPVLEALAAAMKGDPKKRYVVEGHTDDRGVAAQNLTLSDKRAAAVKKWLTEHGVAGDRLQTRGFGQTRPAQSNDSEAGRAANRRVEVAAL